MRAVFDYLQTMNEEAVVLRLAIATILGCFIGWERLLRHHSAGIKTFALVSLGSAVATVLNLYLAMLSNMDADVSRIPAGVVSGIGFLGAGTILVTGKNQIKGLSTAASLWVTSCMGMAIGAGYMVVGIACFFLVLLANVVLIHLSTKVESTSKYMSIYIEVSKNRGVPKLTKVFNEVGFTVNSMTKCREKTLQSTDMAVIIDIDLDKRRSHQDIINMLSELEYVNYVEEV
jgi:putative Mg2+ transporter-C (MgtC) family protein